MAIPKGPFKAEIVGSLLRPPAFQEARARCARGEITPAQLRAIESAHIEAAVALQREAGLKVCSDGEFHRRHWFMDFMERIDGIQFSGGMPVRFHNESGDIEFAPPRLEVRGKLGRSRSLAADDFAELKPVAERHGLVPKQPIPSPTIVHFRGGRAAIDAKAYPDMEGFFADLVAVYRAEVKALYEAGCRYLQIDETNLPYLCDPKLSGHVRSIGEDPVRLLERYVGLINAVVADRPADLAVCMHMCRGNHMSAWVAEGGYDPVAERAFGELAIDGFLLEYDSPRAGSFAPLRYLTGRKVAVLGLVTTKQPALEGKDELKRRIAEAAKVVPLDRLALSPQCGFASTMEGNRVTVEDEKRKLRLVVETAMEVWGTA
ncbi:MAG TPA: 5-methyltetrahydropteroyltriglutamate--homocysteine S-methyltransferase [Stellaceae bacterium]|nr:5-methyltetrahydropteroyltriglutamate--homocysteine S-methyltransferase [Stellaceae bacterium]